MENDNLKYKVTRFARDKNLEKVCNEKWKRPDWFQTIAKAALDKLIFHPLVLFSDKLENFDNISSTILDYESQ